MRIEACSFCSRPVYPSKGILFVRNDARAFRFCRSKCQKNFKMKRNPRKLKWTKSFRKAAGKEMTVDSTLAFAAKRNVAVRYSRDLMNTTVRAMGRVEEIRAKREELFYKMRMASNRRRTLEQDRKLVAENQHLLPPSEQDVPPMAAMEMDLTNQMDQGMDESMWEGLDNEGMNTAASMDLEEDDEDGDDSDEDLRARSRLKHKAVSLKARQKLAVNGSTSLE